MHACVTASLQHHAGCVSEEAFPYRPDIGVNHYSDRVETPQQFVERLAVHDPLKRQDKIHAISKVKGPRRPRPGRQQQQEGAGRQASDKRQLTWVGHVVAGCGWLLWLQHVFQSEGSYKPQINRQPVGGNHNGAIERNLGAR